MAKPLHAFPVKDAQADPRRGYGEHPWITWPATSRLVRVAYWSRARGPAGRSPSRTSTAACGRS